MREDWCTLPAFPEAEGSHLGCASLVFAVTSFACLRRYSQFFSITPFQSIRAISGNSVKIFSWEPGLAYAIFYLFGPESLGGKGNLRLKAEEKARASGKTYKEAVLEVWHHQARHDSSY